MIDAILLAGAPNDGQLKEVSPALSEAMIEIAGRPMIDYVIEALRQSEYIGRIAVVAPPDVGEFLARDSSRQDAEFVAAGDNMLENILRGINYLSDERKVLIVTSDIPLLTTKAVDDFIRRCEAKSQDADLYYPIVAKHINEAAYPGVQRTYVWLREGTFTGGNLALVTPKVLEQGRFVLEQTFALRKKPFQLARLFGFKFIFKLIFRRLSVSEVEEGAFRILGFRGTAVESPYPEIGFDVDKPSDLALVQEIMEKRMAAKGGG